MKPRHTDHVKKELDWESLARALSQIGWNLTKSKSNVKIFERGEETLSAVKFDKKWKVEYFVDKRLGDSAGFSEEWLARVLLLEMALMRSF